MNDFSKINFNRIIQVPESIPTSDIPALLEVLNTFFNHNKDSWHPVQLLDSVIDSHVRKDISIRCRNLMAEQEPFTAQVQELNEQTFAYHDDIGKSDDFIPFEN